MQMADGVVSIIVRQEYGVLRLSINVCAFLKHYPSQKGLFLSMKVCKSQSRRVPFGNQYEVVKNMFLNSPSPS